MKRSAYNETRAPLRRHLYTLKQISMHGQEYTYAHARNVSLSISLLCNSFSHILYLFFYLSHALFLLFSFSVTCINSTFSSFLSLSSSSLSQIYTHTLPLTISLTHKDTLSLLHKHFSSHAHSFSVSFSRTFSLTCPLIGRNIFEFYSASVHLLYFVKPRSSSCL